MANEIMTPTNERWEEFIERLEGKEGCDFKDKIKDKPESITWKCPSKKNKPLATAILKKMRNINIKKSLKYFDEHGGHCDCEILFNVEK